MTEKPNPKVKRPPAVMTKEQQEAHDAIPQEIHDRVESMMKVLLGRPEIPMKVRVR